MKTGVHAALTIQNNAEPCLRGYDALGRPRILQEIQGTRLL